MVRAPDLSGRILDGRYELLELIGEGTFGRVYRGRDHRLERPVAVKVIKPWWAEDPVWVERFAREARTLARVNHPAIVQIFDVGQTGESLYYVAELIEGGSLADRLRGGPLAPDEAVAIAEQLSRALAQAHSQGVIHRDVKPANILLSADGHVKVGDFGVARLADGSSNGAAATAVGTPRYMSPEQARGERTTAASDVYGVGVVLYEMLAGRPPFAGESAVEVAVRHLNDPPPPLPAGVPPQLAAVVERALAKDPAQRFADGAALADALEAIPAAVLRSPAANVAAADAAPAGEALATAVTSAAATRALDAGTAATGLALGREDDSGATALAPPRPPRPPRDRIKTHRPHRRRVLAAVALAAVAAGLVVLLTGGDSRATVPELRGLQRTGAKQRARHDHLRVSFSSRFSSARQGTVIAQRPGPGAHVRRNARVRAVVSAGPRPVAVPSVVGRDAGDARRALEAAGLHAHITRQPTPGARAGSVTRQSPAATATAPPGATVELTVVQAPQWRTLTRLASTGNGDGRSVAFRIRGDRWRVTYDMSYQGACTLLLVCFGPSLDVNKVAAGARVDGFDLHEGSGRTHEFSTGAGIFQVDVSAGSDAARWSMTVQDFY